MSSIRIIGDNVIHRLAKTWFFLSPLFSCRNTAKIAKGCNFCHHFRTLRQAARPIGQGVAAPAQRHAQHRTAQAARQPGVAHRLATSVGQCIGLDQAHGQQNATRWRRDAHPVSVTGAPAQRKTRRGAGLVGGRGNGYDSLAGWLSGLTPAGMAVTVSASPSSSSPQLRQS